MSGLTNEQISKALQIYKLLGVPKTKFVKGSKVLDIFRVLKFKPEVDDFGNRKSTPYELLRVPPQIVNGEEIPIVFAIKNKVSKIGFYTGEVTEFVLKPKRVKEEDSLLESLKISYKHALMFGSEEEAAKYLELIDEYTGGGAEEFLKSFYDYSKFYRRMKKQLIIDIFAHFFLLYMSAASLTIKEGIIKSGKYKPFREDKDIPVLDAKDVLPYESSKSEDMPILTEISIDKTFDEQENLNQEEKEDFGNFKKDIERNIVLADENSQGHSIPENFGHNNIDNHSRVGLGRRRKFGHFGFRKCHKFNTSQEEQQHRVEKNDKFLQQEENQSEFDFQS